MIASRKCGGKARERMIVAKEKGGGRNAACNRNEERSGNDEPKTLFLYTGLFCAIIIVNL